MPKRAILPLLLLLAAISPAGADTLLTVKTRVEGLNMPGQSPEGEVRIWVAGDRLRRDDGEISYVLRLDQGKLYVLNHGDKTYTQLTLADLQKAQDDPLKTAVEVTPTTETRKIKDWNAKKYKIRISNAAGLNLETTTWASTDVLAHGALNRMAMSLSALQPGGAVWGRELAKIEGFPVLNESSVTLSGSRFKTREELVSIAEKQAPAGQYDPPAGYSPR
jgi:hypothetical protein